MRGWIRTSVGAAVKDPDGSKQIVQRTLGDALTLHQDERAFTIFRDNRSGLEYIRRSDELCERGLYFELAAYTCHVFMDFREVYDNELRHYEHITAYLNGRGVPNVEDALQEILLQPVHHPFSKLVNTDLFRRLMKKRITKAGAAPNKKFLEEVEGKAQTLLRAIKEFTGGGGDEALAAREIRDRLKAALRLSVRMDGEIGAYLRSGLDDDPAVWGTLFGWLFVHNLGKVAAVTGFEEVSRSWLDEWQLGRILSGALLDLGLDQEATDYAVTLVKVLTAHQRWLESGGMERIYAMLSSLFQDIDVQRALLVNRHQEILWFNKEAFEQLLWWMFVTTTIAYPSTATKRAAAEILNCWEMIRALQQVSEASGYQVENLLEGARGLQEGENPSG